MSGTPVLLDVTDTPDGKPDTQTLLFIQEHNQTNKQKQGLQKTTSAEDERRLLYGRKKDKGNNVHSSCLIGLNRDLFTDFIKTL